MDWENYFTTEPGTFGASQEIYDMEQIYQAFKERLLKEIRENPELLEVEK